MGAEPLDAVVARLSDAAVELLARVDPLALRAGATELRRVANTLDDVAEGLERLECASEAAAVPVAEVRQ